MQAFINNPLPFRHDNAVVKLNRSCQSRHFQPLTTTTNENRRTLSMVAKPENEPDVKISSTVERLYDTYPFPPETLLDETPLGYNWRWHYPSVYSFCTGRTPPPRSLTEEPLRILDAGCGTGESTSFLIHQNPGAKITAIDLSNGALNIAKERIHRSLPNEQHRVEFHHLSIFDIDDLDSGILYDWINCVGVIHHTPDPLRALKSLSRKLKPGGFIHIFVYGVTGRWEISLMQKALQIIQQNNENNFEKGVELGRRVFKTLPDGNRLKERERSRWSQENLKDATFADMYLHPQEIDYDVNSLFGLIDQCADVEFLGFSNPRTWDFNRLLSNDEQLLKQVNSIKNKREQYRLIECLDPEAITHFEFFLGKSPLPTRNTWNVDTDLLNATVTMSECLFGWPSKVLMDRDYYPIQLTDQQFEFIKAVHDGNATDQSVIVDKAVSVSAISLDDVRQLAEQGVVLLSPSS